MDDRTVVYTLAGVAILLLAVISYNNTMAKRQRLTSQAAPSGDLLIKFARHEGHVVGETVAMDGDMLILKQAGVFKAVQADAARVVEDEVVLSGVIDWAAAEAAGTAWHQRSTKGQDDEITAHLTTSADVRAPALKALEEE